MITLERINTDNTTILYDFNDLNNTATDVLNDIDHGDLNDEQKETILDYINECNKNKPLNYVCGAYYKVSIKNDIDNFYDRMMDGVCFNDVECYICSKINDYGHDDDNFKISLLKVLKNMGIKGVADNMDEISLVRKMYGITRHGDELSRAMDLYLKDDGDREYYLYIGADALSMLTSSTGNILSCFNLCSGGYRGSNIYYMRDSRTLILKVFPINDTTTDLLKKDELKYSFNAICRKHIILDDNKNDDGTIKSLLVGRTYGDRTLNKYNLIKKVVSDFFGLNFNTIIKNNNANHSDIYLCDDYHGYNELECFAYILTDHDDYIRPSVFNFGYNADVDIPWKPRTDRIYSAQGCMCACCGCELDEDSDETYYIDGETYCCDCVRYDDSQDEYFPETDEYVIIDDYYYSARYHDIGHYNR